MAQGGNTEAPWRYRRLSRYARPGRHPFPGDATCPVFGDHLNEASREQRRGWEQPSESQRAIPVPMLVTAAAYIKEGSGYDRSVEDTVSGIVPSPYLIERLGIRWSGQDFVYSGTKGEHIAWDPSAKESGPPALLVDLPSLLKLLNDEGLALVWTVLGEKNISIPISSDKEFKGRLEVFGVATLRNGKVELIGMKSEFHAPSSA